MRKLKLQMQVSIDGFVAGPNGELDWMTWDMDENLLGRINSLIDSSDTIIMGRKMTDGFVNYWAGVLETPESPEFDFAKKMVDTPKVVFSKTLNASPWKNTILANGNIVEEVNKLKTQEGKDILVYGGARLAASLIEHNLIDEYHLFVNPIAIGNGMRIFVGKTSLKFTDSTPYECGIVANQYQRV